MRCHRLVMIISSTFCEEKTGHCLGAFSTVAVMLIKSVAQLHNVRDRHSKCVALSSLNLSLPKPAGVILHLSGVPTL